MPKLSRLVHAFVTNWAYPRPRCALQGDAGDAATTKVLLVEKASQEFVFTEVPERPVLSALRDFSAPVKLQVRLCHLTFS